MARFSLPQFIREVRQEASKVTWPTRKETTVSTGMVVLMVIVMALFFMLVDWLLSIGVQLFLGFGA